MSSILKTHAPVVIDNKATGLALKRLREANGLLMREVARKWGMSVTNYARLEDGTRTWTEVACNEVEAIILSVSKTVDSDRKRPFARRPKIRPLLHIIDDLQNQAKKTELLMTELKNSVQAAKDARLKEGEG